MIRTMIVDDEPLARELIRDLLREDSEIEVVAECRNGQEALESIGLLQPDLLFLDVQMPGASGMEVVARLPADQIPQVVFVTAYDRYAIEAFRARALDYLLKPFSKERFRESLRRAKEAIQRRRLVGLAAEMTALARSYADLHASLAVDTEVETEFVEFLSFRSGRQLKRLAVSEIAWIEAANQYVRLHTATGSCLLARSLNSLERELDPARFCRIHRSTIVQTSQVREVRLEKNGACSVLLVGGERLRVSRRRRQAWEAAWSAR